MKEIGVIYFEGEDYGYHNRGHFETQLMCRFTRMGTTLYVDSVAI